MKPKILKLEEWKKKASKLKKKYKSYDDLKEDCSKKIGTDYYMLSDFIDDIKNDVILITADNIFEGSESHDRVHISRDLPVYLRNKDGTLKRLDFDTMVEAIIPKLRKHVDVNMLLRDALLDETPSFIQDVYERVIKPKKKPKIAPSPECFYLSIGGKPGAPAKLYLRT